MIWLLFLMLAAAPAVFPQQQKSARKVTPKKKAPAQTTTTPIPADKWPIASITIEGNKLYSAGQVIAASGLKAGQMAGKNEFEAARDRLQASGCFETVGYKFAPAPGSNHFAASFQVVEVQPAYQVRFERLDAPDSELKTWLKGRDPLFGDRVVATAGVVARHAAAIEEYLVSKGRKDKVIGRVVADGPDQFSVLFRPAASDPVVAEVRFQGNEAIPSTVLLNAFSGVAFGAVYREPTFRLMLDNAVRPLYDARGRVKLAYTKIITEKAQSVEGLIVTVTVEEGPVFNLGQVRLAGDVPVPAAELLKAAKFKSDEVANFDEISAGVEVVKKRLRREGYMRAAIEVERKLNERTKIVDLLLKITPGPQFLFGKLVIEGLDIHGEAAIKKLWIMKPAKPYNSDYPEFFLKRIEEDGVFDDLGPTKAKPAIDEENRIVDVTLVFSAPAADPTKPGARGPSTKGRRRR